MDVAKSKAVTDDSGKKDLSIQVSLKVTNTGSVVGSEIVQLYVTYPAASELTHPPLLLRSFKKVHDLQPGECRSVSLELDKYAVSYWEDRIRAWTVDSGEYGVLAGPSSDNLPLKGVISLGKTDAFEWNGL